MSRHLPFFLTLPALALVTLSGCSRQSPVSSHWHGSYDWGAETNTVSLQLGQQLNRVTDIQFSANYKEELSQGTIVIKEHSSAGNLLGFAEVDGDTYRFTGSLIGKNLQGRFARKEFDDWVDEGGIACRPVVKEVQHAH